jgi:glucose-1-phosphate cytidylyltransferase
MKTIILAGGWGTRLGKLTEEIPKPMLMVGNRPLIWHIMKYYAHYGYKDFIVSAGVKADVLKQFFLEYDSHTQDFTKDFSTGEIEIHSSDEKLDWKVTIVNTGLNTLKGARIKRLEKYLAGDTHMVTYGDGLANINIQKLTEFHHKHGKMVTISGVHPAARFGEIIERDSQVVSFEEKPQTSVGLINGGFIVFNTNLLAHLSTDQDCDFEFSTLETLSAKGEIMVYKHEGRWECVDHERDLSHLNTLWSTGQAFWKVW